MAVGARHVRVSERSTALLQTAEGVIETSWPLDCEGRDRGKDRLDAVLRHFNLVLCVDELPHWLAVGN